MLGTDATGIPARDGDGNTIPAPIAPAPVNPVAPPAPLAQDVSDTVILTAIGTLTSALGAQEGHAKLIVNSIQKLVDSFQRIDPSQTAGTLEEFGNSFGSLADTLKDLFSAQRVKESLAEDQRR